MERLIAVLNSHFHTDHVRIASMGGSATWGMRFPEDLVGDDKVVAKFEGFDTPFGYGAAMKLLDVDGEPVLRITHQGWKYGRNEFPSANDSLQVFYVLWKAGVQRIVVDGSCGGITARQNDLILSTDFVDLQSNPTTTLFAQTIGVDSWKRLADPFCADIRQLLARHAAAERETLRQTDSAFQFGRIIGEGVYVTTPPGLFETRAQVQWYQQLGGNVVGQSLGFIAKLARICDMCIAAVHIVSNDAEGLPADFGETSLKDIYFDCAKPMARIVWNVLLDMVHENAPRSCACQSYKKDTDLSGLPVKGA